MTNNQNRNTTYTVLDRHGNVQSDGETLEGAALIVLGYDGHQHEIRNDGDIGFSLWTSQRGGGGNVPMISSVIYSLEADEGLATADMYHKIIQNAEWWDNQRVVTDAYYAAEIAEINAEHASN